MSVKITPEEIADLPPELVKQLVGQGSWRASNSLTRKLVAMIETTAEPLSLNNLLIGMYRFHGKILKRRNLQSLMHHAVMRGYVTKLDGGLYGPARNPT